MFLALSLAAQVLIRSNRSLRAAQTAKLQGGSEIFQGAVRVELVFYLSAAAVATVAIPVANDMMPHLPVRGRYLRFAGSCQHKGTRFQAL